MLDKDEARLLDRLIVGTAASTAAASGLRRTRSRGAGLEFQEYRRYQSGDDPRWIDWTVEARLQQLVVRVPRADGHSRIHLLVDSSASMGLGSPAKLACATRIAAAIGYIAAEHRDAVAVSTFVEGIGRHLPLAPGRLQLFRMLAVLRQALPAGTSAIDRVLMQYAAIARGPGLVLVLSDFFEPGSRIQALRFLLHRGLTPAIIQVLSPEELRPLFDDVMELVDIEDHAGRTVVVHPDAVASYVARLEQQSLALRAFCVEQGLPYVRVDSTLSLAEILPVMAKAGLIVPRG